MCYSYKQVKYNLFSSFLTHFELKRQININKVGANSIFLTHEMYHFVLIEVEISFVIYG
jgi:hypothetical protein